MQSEKELAGSQSSVFAANSLLIIFPLWSNKKRSMDAPRGPSQSSKFMELSHGALLFVPHLYPPRDMASHNFVLTLHNTFFLHVMYNFQEHIETLLF